MAARTAKPATIAVLMATYNDKPAVLNVALQSVLTSKTPVDVYLVDDGSPTPAETIAQPAPNLHVLRLEKNVGLPRALNHGLDHILNNPQYEYVARFDSDDISHPERFPRQLEFLETNPEISLVGSWAQVVDENGNLLFHFNPPTSPQGIRRAMVGNSCILHPSWLVRASVFRREGGYNPNFPIAQDYELLTRLMHKGYQFAQLPEYLLQYRVSSGGISVTKRRRQLAARLRIQLRHFNPLNLFAWAGVAKTLVLFITPAQFVQRLKSTLKSYRAR